MHAEPIYHLAPLPELRAGCGERHYAPARLRQDGFVHCSAGRAVTLAVAGDYFAESSEPLVLLVIDPDRLSAPLRFEEAAPIPGGGSRHRRVASRFPHVYGPIDRAAIERVGQLGRGPREFTWPARFESLDALLARA